MQDTIYLDYNATTPVREAVLAAMEPYWRDDFANASSYHSMGRRCRQAIENAREQVADAIDAHPSEVFFTSSGTESNNTILKGVAKMSIRQRIAVGATEHACILCAARSLRSSHQIDFIAVDSNGLVDQNDLDETLQADCALVSVMLANNETGVVQDIAHIAEKVKSAGAYSHTDAAQAMGKIPLSFSQLGVDAMTLSGHKFYAPKGTAALILKHGVSCAPLLEGGGQEKGLRSGTENVAGIVGFAKACEIAAAGVKDRQRHMITMRDSMEKTLIRLGATVFGSTSPRLPNTCYFGLPNIDGGTMVELCGQAGFAVASGSACSSMSDSPSHVLMAMDISSEIARTAVRVSLGEDTTLNDVMRFAETVGTICEQLSTMQSLRY